MEVIIDTYESYWPSFIPIQDKIHQQFWYYNEEQVFSQRDRQSEDFPLAMWNFYRSTRTQSYERRYKTIDTMFAEVVGIVSIVAFMVNFFIRPYSIWRYNHYIAHGILGKRQPKVGFFSYIGSLFRSTPQHFKKALEKAE